MRRALNDAFARFRDDEAAWVAIVTGAGRAFCAGADLRDGAGATGEFPGSFWEKPTVELVRERLGDLQAGHRSGERALPRLRAHARDMVRLRARERQGTIRLSRGRSRDTGDRGRHPVAAETRWADAMEMLMTGEPVDAEKAQQIGLVWRVVPHDDLITAANRLADRLVKGAPLAQRAMKEMAMRAPAPVVARGDPDGRGHANRRRTRPPMRARA